MSVRSTNNSVGTLGILLDIIHQNHIEIKQQIASHCILRLVSLRRVALAAITRWQFDSILEMARNQQLQGAIWQNNGMP